ncbi:hypothetical protein J7413_06470 [Shimia sp. R10_1]|uniref:hypothetical protein n=1 Tax=Shimia sp. R10_1 TaxID=2821095 RepID=UPI001ADB2A31|nr:hypothetical protein [Shimia sp. R10_1]MBO9473179.1 hypothetical protein [Shimia sp. R10_1]
MDQEFEQFLTDISQAFVRRDLARWRSRLLLPFSLITKRAPIILRTEAAVAENFALYLRAMDLMNGDFVDRAPIGLEQCPDGSWLGTFQTRLLSREQLAADPYTSTALLRVQNNRFRMSSMLNARGHYDWTGVVEND